MSRPNDKLELHGEVNLPQSGVLVIPNRLAPEDLVELERRLEGRRVVHLVERGAARPPALRAHLDREGGEILEFSADEASADAFQRDLRERVDGGGVVVFVPGPAHVRSGQVVAVATATLRFLTGTGVPVLPLFVDHPGETALSVEDRDEVDRIVLSFGEPLGAGEANLANFTERLLVAAERAFSARPILDGHLAYETLRGLKKHGASTSIIDGVDGVTLRFDKLLAASIVLSRIIRKETAKKRVGIILPPGKGGTVANVAVLLSGKVPVNLNFTTGEKAFRASVERADIDRFITADRFVRKMSSFPWPPSDRLLLVDQVLPAVKRQIVLWLGLSKLMPARLLASVLGVPREGGHEEAVLLFTSGSSGEPKGVVLSHRNLLANVNQFGARIDLDSDDKILGCLPLFHSFGCTVTLWYPLIEGVTLVTYPSPLETSKLAELIEKHGVNLVLATPTFLRGYLRRAKKEQFAAVKMVITGAEKLPAKVAEKFQQAFAHPVLEGYGLTETSPVTNVNLPDETGVGDDGRGADGLPVITNERPGSVGLFIPGMAARITDPETDEPRSVHDSGMIWLKGANIFEGYLDEPEKTAAVIRDGWFRTGDIGRLDEDGFLHIEGRLSRFSKIAGEMVPHETVEDVINHALGHTDDERRIAVVGVPDEAKGEALVLLSAVPDVDLQELRGQLTEAGLPALWVPKKVIEVEDVPSLASGKLDIKTCMDLAEAGE